MLASSRSALSALLNAGADPNARDDEGATPLIHHAIRNEPTENLRLLLEAGAEPDRSDSRERTPLMFCASAESARALMDAGADPNARDREGAVAVMLVAHPETVEALLEGGADPRLLDGKERDMFEFPPKNEPVILDCKISRLFALLAERVISGRETFQEACESVLYKALEPFIAGERAFPWPMVKTRKALERWYFDVQIPAMATEGDEEDGAIL